MKIINNLRVLFFVVLLLAVSDAVSAQRCYILVERTNLRRYDNDKYTGLVSREVRSVIRSSAAPRNLAVNIDYEPTDTWYDGFFYVTEQTKRSLNNVAAGIHDSIPAVFRIQNTGHLVMYEDNGYPSFRSFPAFQKGKTHAGDYWTATAERAVDPLNKGIVTRIPMEVAYTFVREEQFNGESVYRLTAKWATRYGELYSDPNGDPDMQKAVGSHNANILISKVTGNAVLVSDQVDETFVYKDDHAVTLKGTITLFTEYPPAVPRNKLIPALNRIAEMLPKSESADSSSSRIKQAVTERFNSNAAGDTGKITVEDTSAGLRLSIQDLQFKADSAELLPGEKDRLDKIASVLKLAPDSQFLVEGHTASIGKEAGELKLSKERAHSIAAELVKRGIPAEKFLCRGWGADKPVADNSTDEGRARNRRVEITIIE